MVLEQLKENSIAIAESIKDGKIDEALQKVIELKFDPEYTDGHVNNLLYIALEKTGRVDLICALMDKDVSSIPSFEDEKNARLIANEKGYAEIYYHLLTLTPENLYTKYSNIPETDKDRFEKIRNSYFIYNYLMPGLKCHVNIEDIVSEIFNSGIFQKDIKFYGLNFSKDKMYCNSLLHVAVENRDYKMYWKLVNAGVDPNIKNHDGKPAEEIVPNHEKNNFYYYNTAAYKIYNFVNTHKMELTLGLLITATLFVHRDSPEIKMARNIVNKILDSVVSIGEKIGLNR